MGSPTRIACTIPSADLADVATWAARHIGGRPTNPLLLGALIVLDDGYLSITGYDEEVSATARTHIDPDGADRPGRALVSGVKLAELTRTFPTGKTVTITQDDRALTMTCGSTKVTLPTMVEDNYPRLPGLPIHLGTLDDTVFDAALARCLPAVDVTGKHETPQFTAMHVTFAPDRVELVGTDRYRLATTIIDGAAWQMNPDLAGQLAEDPARALVPGTMLAGLRKAVGAGPFRVGLNDNVVSFSTPGRRVIGRLLAGHDYPDDLRKVTLGTRDGLDRVAALDSVAFVAALKRARVSLEKDSDPVRLDFGADTVRLSTDTVEDPLPCNYDGPAFAGYHARVGFLLAAVAACGTPTVELRLPTDVHKAAVMTAPDDPHFAYLFMPVRKKG